MNPLEITRTEDSPAVNFDFETHSYKMEGESRPENAGIFYKPIIKWVRDLKAHLFFVADMNKDIPGYRKDLNFEFSFEYLNSTSLKFIFDLMKEIENLNDTRHTVRITWYYHKDDELMKENGEDFAHLMKSEVVLKES